MTRVAILAPMRSELRPLVARLALAAAPGRDPQLLWGSAGRVEVVATLSGIGMSAGARAAARVLDATSPDHLIVVGIAGGIGEGVAVGDPISPELVLDLETGETFRPLPLVGDARGADLAARRCGTLASADSLLAPEEARRLGERGVVAVDMETAAIAAVCQARGCPWSVFRAISDRADDGTTDAAILGLAAPDGSPRLAALARFVLTRPHRIAQLARLGRGARAASRAAARAAVAGLESL